MKIDLEQILNVTSDYYSVPVNMIMAKLNRKDIVKARHVYCYLASEMTNFGLVEIGKFINRDHATAHHGIKKIRNHILIYKDLSAEIEVLKAKIRPKNKLEVIHVDLLASTIYHTKSLLIKP